MSIFIFTCLVLMAVTIFISIVLLVQKKNPDIFLISVPICGILLIFIFLGGREKASQDFQEAKKVDGIEGINYLYIGKVDDKVCLGTFSGNYDEYQKALGDGFNQITKYNVVYCEKQGLGE